MCDAVEIELGAGQLESEPAVPVGEMRLGLDLDHVRVVEYVQQQSACQAPTSVLWVGDDPADFDVIVIGNDSQSCNDVAIAVDPHMSGDQVQAIDLGVGTVLLHHEYVTSQPQQIVELTGGQLIEPQILNGARHLRP